MAIRCIASHSAVHPPDLSHRTSFPRSHTHRTGAPVVDQATQEYARSVRHLKRGSIVRVRSREWLVTEIIKPPAKKQDSLVRQACLEGEAQGETLDVLWERERDAAVGDDITAYAAYAELEKGFDPPRLFSAWLHTL